MNRYQLLINNETVPVYTADEVLEDLKLIASIKTASDSMETRIAELTEKSNVTRSRHKRYKLINERDELCASKIVLMERYHSIFLKYDTPYVEPTQ